MPKQTKGPSITHLAARDERVFPFYPQVSRYFPSAAMEDARKRLGRAIERGDGPGVIIGAPGTGKSLLLQVLAAQYQSRFDVVLLACARLCTRRALLQAILFELGLPYKSRDEGELRLSLLDHLLSTDGCPTGLLLLVDEAHTLPMPLLDELRVMTNLVRGDRPRVRVVLAGSSALEESFAHPDLESFSQRLAARCYLVPLSCEETTQFIRAQLALLGEAPEEIFAPDAWSAVYEATDGVPRLVNQLCDRAIEFSASGGGPPVDRAAVQRAWSDLQQLPTPWDTPAVGAAPAAASQVVEYGRLNEDQSFCQGNQPEHFDDTEPTELDTNDDTPDVNGIVVAPSRSKAFAESKVADPFAEKFDEEEVVLDNFAGWDDLIASHCEMPRVENRRDPGFATLVQAAIDASPQVGQPRAAAAQLGVLRQTDSHDSDSELEIQDDISPANSTVEHAQERSGNWPPLRLAVVSDFAPLKATPLVPASSHLAAEVVAALDSMARVDIGKGAGKQAATKAPVLLVEDHHAPAADRPGSPVRREAYTNLFSRLRSG